VSSERIGFIGLGRMGRGMARNLLAAGVDLTAFDLDPGAVADLTTAGACAADSAAALAARVDRVFLCLPFAPEVRATLFGEGGLCSGAREGLRVVDCTTLIRSDALEIAARAAESGLGYNDCPISGMPFRAADGTLTIMFGGDVADFEAVRPLLAHMGSDVIHCGALGSGQLMKAVNNVIYDINIAALCELLPLATEAGLDPQTVAAVVTSGSSRSFASEYFVPRMLEGRFEGDFSMAQAWKDIVNVQEIAVRHGAMTPLTAAMTAIYQTAIAQGHGGEPKSAMIKVYEQVLGAAFRKSAP
jgi:3-hydroxyisobutyrate dehydrogenase-like beta-hydroxyacid dehydrogenase